MVSMKKKLKPTTHSSPSSTVSKRPFKYAWLLRSILIIHGVVTVKLPNVYLKALDTMSARLVVAALVILLLCVDIVSAAILVAAYIFALVIYRNRTASISTSVSVSSVADESNTLSYTGGVIPEVPSGMPSDIADNLFPRADPGRDRGMPGVENMQSVPNNQYEAQIGTLPVTREQGMFGSQMLYAKVNQGQQDTTLSNMVEGFGNQCGAQITKSHEAFDGMGQNHGQCNSQVDGQCNGYDDGALKTFLEAQRALNAGFTTADHLRKAQTNTVAGCGEVAMDHQVVASQSNMWNSQGAPSTCQAPGTNNQLCYSGVNMNSLNLAKNFGM